MGRVVNNIYRDIIPIYDLYCPAMIRFLERALRPLVSLLIRNGVTHRRFSELMKRVYVDVAAAEFGKGGRPTNTTRISLLTGIDRKQIKRIRERLQRDEEVFEPQQSNVLGRILSAWHQDQEFSSAGAPKALSVDSAFQTMCKRYGGDNTPTAILKELLNAGAIQQTADNQVVAIARYYQPLQTDTSALERSLDVYHDIGSTLLHNLYRSPDQASRFEGRATNAFVPKDKIDEFRAYVETAGQRWLEQADAELSNTEKVNVNQSATVRVGLGLYWIEESKE